jgi:hypothetical protein
VQAAPEHFSEASTRGCKGQVIAVDLLIVVDSASMSEERTKLAQNLARFGELLSAADNPFSIDFRIAITTASVAHPACDGPARNGSLEVESCLTNLDKVVIEESGESAAADRREACLAVCSLDALETLPTTTHLDPVPRARPWFEVGRRDGSHDNLPEGVSLAHALACAGLVGLEGCRFEQPLEAVRRAYQRFSDPGDPAYGFLRQDAVPMILVITDEADCSTADPSIFDPEGARAFWGGEAAPTSAVCWRAGTSCSGDGPVYGGCEPASYAADGTPAQDPAQAALRPVTELVAELAAVELDLQSRCPSCELVVAGITGVPGQYEHGQEILYADALDPAWQAEFGIGPGCIDSGAAPVPQLAVPPVRIRDWGEAFGDRDLHSICEQDWSGALSPLLDHIAIGPLPYCFKHCPKDVDPDTSGLQVECIVQTRTCWQIPFEPVDVPECEGDADEPQVPAGSDWCYQAIVDPAALADACVIAGLPLEFRMHARDDRVGTCFEATCQISVEIADCPGME